MGSNREAYWRKGKKQKKNSPPPPPCAVWRQEGCRARLAHTSTLVKRTMETAKRMKT